jgi:hypothetical protein
MVHDLLPLALRGVQRCGDRLLAVGVVARNVEELAGRARHAAPESVDEGRARRAILECRDGVIVGRVVAPGSSVQRLEKRRMYSRRLSIGCCLQLRSSHFLPEHM